MNPNNNQPGNSGNADKQAVANVIRANIEALYQQQTDQTEYTQNLDTTPVLDEASKAAWAEYHTAWQNYYQKYYESYYQKGQEARTNLFANQPELEAKQEIVTKEEALGEIKSQLLKNVSDTAKKVRKSRHFMPIIAALIVVLAGLFVQYNKILVGTVMAYVTPGGSDSQEIVVNSDQNVAVDPNDTSVIIPKINVKVPVSYDIGNDYNSQMNAMKSGLAWFGVPGADSHPGEVGNTVVAGHSSNDLFDTGDYKFIFAQLDKMVKGDTFYADYHGKRYTYVVSDIKIVSPTDVSAVQVQTDKPLMTLLTCTPVGTSRNRLLVIGEQVSPDPSSATKSTGTASSSNVQLSGSNSPSLFEKLFGAN